GAVIGGVEDRDLDVVIGAVGEQSGVERDRLHEPWSAGHQNDDWFHALAAVVVWVREEGLIGAVDHEQAPGHTAALVAAFEGDRHGAAQGGSRRRGRDGDGRRSRIGEDDLDVPGHGDRLDGGCGAGSAAAAFEAHRYLGEWVR